MSSEALGMAWSFVIWRPWHIIIYLTYHSLLFPSTSLPPLFLVYAANLRELAGPSRHFQIFASERSASAYNNSQTIPGPFACLSKRQGASSELERLLVYVIFELTLHEVSTGRTAPSPDLSRNTKFRSTWPNS